MIVFRLYLGRTIPDRNDSRVSDAEFQDFLSHAVSTRFPCYTVYDAKGVWEGEEEKSTVLEIIADARRCTEKIVLVAKIYKEWFNQVSVLVTQHQVDVDFI